MLYKVGLRTLPYLDAERANWNRHGPRPLLTGYLVPGRG
jgi:hypothetical protein